MTAFQGHAGDMSRCPPPNPAKPRRQPEKKLNFFSGGEWDMSRLSRCKHPHLWASNRQQAAQLEVPKKMLN